MTKDEKFTFPRQESIREVNIWFLENSREDKKKRKKKKTFSRIIFSQVIFTSRVKIVYLHTFTLK